MKLEASNHTAMEEEWNHTVSETVCTQRVHTQTQAIQTYLPVKVIIPMTTDKTKAMA